jgi:hypothetical protein
MLDCIMKFCGDGVINLKTLGTTSTYARKSWLLDFDGGAQE